MQELAEAESALLAAIEAAELLAMRNPSEYLVAVLAVARAAALPYPVRWATRRAEHLLKVARLLESVVLCEQQEEEAGRAERRAGIAEGRAEQGRDCAGSVVGGVAIAL